MSRNVAIVLAAGQGKRMGGKIAKQFLEVGGKPLLYYSLRAMEESFMDEVVLVTGENDISFCMNEIVEKYGFKKVSHIVAGGAERYHSVYNGLCAVGECDYVYIHDGARPFVDAGILERNREAVERFGACVTAVGVKDTIKIKDEEGFVAHTPARDSLCAVQTPQTFAFTFIKEAYERFFDRMEAGAVRIPVTDDAMVAEIYGGARVKLVEGSFENVKITTPEDLGTAEIILAGRGNGKRA